MPSLWAHIASAECPPPSSLDELLLLLLDPLEEELDDEDPEELLDPLEEDEELELFEELDDFEDEPELEELLDPEPLPLRPGGGRRCLSAISGSLLGWSEHYHRPTSPREFPTTFQLDYFGPEVLIRRSSWHGLHYSPR
jgi:hypothetical protein